MSPWEGEVRAVVTPPARTLFSVPSPGYLGLCALCSLLCLLQPLLQLLHLLNPRQRGDAGMASALYTGHPGCASDCADTPHGLGLNCPSQVGSRGSGQRFPQQLLALNPELTGGETPMVLSSLLREEKSCPCSLAQAPREGWQRCHRSSGGTPTPVPALLRSPPCSQH